MHAVFCKTSWIIAVLFLNALHSEYLAISMSHTCEDVCTGEAESDEAVAKLASHVNIVNRNAK